MSGTNFPHGVYSMGALLTPVGVPMGGDHYFVRPYSGSNAMDGRTPQTAVKTLAYALSLATADQNDVIHLIAESNSDAQTTDYQSATLAWNKNMVHLVGECAPSPMSQRASVALISTYVTASNLFTLSASGCLVQNVQFFAGVNSNQPTGAVQVSGSRNVFRNCHIAGIGHDTMDVANGYSLYLNGGEENLFQACRIGLNTIDAGSAANAEISIAGGAKNVFFEGCYIYRRIEHATNHPLVRLAAATSIAEFLIFNQCSFVSTSTNYAHTQSGAFKLTADLTQGIILVKDCLLYNGPAGAAGKWDVDDRDRIKIVGHPTPAADTCSITRAV